MEHTHNYPDGSEQLPFTIPDLDDVLGAKGGPTDDHMAEAVADARVKLIESLTGLKKSNKRKFDEMVRMGVQPAPTAILLARLEQLLDMILDEDSRLGFDIGFEARMAKILEEGLADARKANIAGTVFNNPAQWANGNGGPPGAGPGLILPG